MFDSRRSNHKDKIIISAALTGAVTTKNDNPALPTQPDEIVESAWKCYEAGAACSREIRGSPDMSDAG